MYLKKIKCPNYAGIVNATPTRWDRLSRPQLRSKMSHNVVAPKRGVRPGVVKWGVRAEVVKHDPWVGGTRLSMSLDFTSLFLVPNSPFSSSL